MKLLTKHLPKSSFKPARAKVRVASDQSPAPSSPASSDDDQNLRKSKKRKNWAEDLVQIRYALFYIHNFTEDIRLSFKTWNIRREKSTWECLIHELYIVIFLCRFIFIFIFNMLPLDKGHLLIYISFSIFSPKTPKDNEVWLPSIRDSITAYSLAFCKNMCRLL